MIKAKPRKPSLLKELKKNKVSTKDKTKNFTIIVAIKEKTFDKNIIDCDKEFGVYNYKCLNYLVNIDKLHTKNTSAVDNDSPGLYY